jgi:hypothetical protein
LILWGAKYILRNAKLGETRWFAPFKHRVQNVGDPACNAVYIGIKSKQDVISQQDSTPFDPETTKIVLGLLSSAGSIPQSPRYLAESEAETR